MTSITIVICVHNQLPVTHRCIDSLLGSAKNVPDMVIVDDGSRPSFSVSPAYDNRQICVLTNPRRLGYTRSANRGLKAADADVVLLTNSDTRFPPGAIERLSAVLDSGAHLCSPLSNAASWQSVPELFDRRGDWSTNPVCQQAELDTMDGIVQRVSRRQYPAVPLLNGFCLAIRREVFETIGWFDETSFPMGYGEETDFCIRAQRAGLTMRIADDTYVFHEKSRSFGHWRRRWYSRRGGRALVRKWGREALDCRIAEMRDQPVLASMRQAVAQALKQDLS